MPPEKCPAATATAGAALRTAVFGKLIPLLGGMNRLLLAPDGELSLVPFEALPLGDGRLLIENYHISYIECGRDVQRFGVTSGRQSNAPLIVADPAFNLTVEAMAASAGAAASDAPADSSAGGDEGKRQSRELDREMRFGPLKRTREEGEKIGAMLDVKPWLKADALERRLKRAQSPRVLHLATHGFFLPDENRDPNKESGPARAKSPEGLLGRLSGPGMENPLLRSGLALAGVNVWLRGGQVPEEAEDGLLTAEDVTGMDLLDTELVVLSACETGLGDVHIGEGVFGLRRAFVLAGASRLVMSLWKVPDEQTQELMVDFYSRVLAGEGVPEALRGAQLALRQRHSDPYFWGAFICLGDPSPLPRGTTTLPAVPSV